MIILTPKTFCLKRIQMGGGHIGAIIRDTVIVIDGDYWDLLQASKTPTENEPS
jgi:hypothetical protein